MRLIQKRAWLVFAFSLATIAFVLLTGCFVSSATAQKPVDLAAERLRNNCPAALIVSTNQFSISSDLHMSGRGATPALITPLDCLYSSGTRVYTGHDRWISAFRPAFVWVARDLAEDPEIYLQTTWDDVFGVVLVDAQVGMKFAETLRTVEFLALGWSYDNFRGLDPTGAEDQALIRKLFESPEECKTRLLKLGGGPAVNADSLQMIVRLPRLEGLSLLGTFLPPEELLQLCEIPSLAILDLDKTRVTDATVAEICKLDSLRALSLSGTAITDGALDHIGELENLKHLRIEKTIVSQAAVEKLRAKLPELKVFHSFVEQPIFLVPPPS